ncbi:FecR family protein [uncultured Paludibaculum sp.]|uniref:FecR family protein n=1 Tax=uncultured Paludibaculum sp. TaxID=1765020 RepID=UPI002AABD68A|nr:FecR family protein [uncultured Paludibaculum sp.]
MSARSGLSFGKVITALLLASFALPVLEAQSFLQTDTAARAITVQGSVSLVRDTEMWAVSMGDSIQARQVVVTGPDGYAAFRVSDGSTFEVFPNSRVTFRANPGNWRDMVDVWLGRIRVHIQKLGGQPNPNRIHTPTAVISVRGTIFDISVEDDDETTRVAVEEGLVAVEHRLMPRDGDPRLVAAGEELVVYRNAPLALDRRLDRGRFMQYVADAVYQILIRTPRLGGSGGTGGVPGGGTTPPPTSGGGVPGDTGATPPPPPPPAPGN